MNRGFGDDSHASYRFLDQQNSRESLT